MRIAGANERRSFSLRKAAHRPVVVRELGCYGALLGIARSGAEWEVLSGAALSSWPVELQGLRKET